MKVLSPQKIANSPHKKIGIRRAILEEDSLAVIKALEEDSLAVKVLAQNFEQLLYSHTKREGNVIAHSLVRHAIGILGLLVWIKDVPS